LRVSISHVVFDLDGTLVDSALGILSALDGAFGACSLTPVQVLSEEVIGPPLMETLAGLSGTRDSSTLRMLASAFKDCYDNDGYRQTVPYVGVECMLGELKSRGYCVSIATNKRILPTERLIRYLGWESFFSGIYALDSFVPALKVKTDMLAYVLAQRGLAPRSTVYVGDRGEDGQAATANQMPFLLAAWGYGKTVADAGWVVVQSPDEVSDVIDGLL
jgi:phosphoglycolate phosphatase